MAENPTLFNQRNRTEHRPVEDRLREIEELRALGYNLKQIANMTGLDYGYIRVLLCKHNHSEKDNKNVMLKNCPECGAPVREEDREVVCSTCGLVVREKMFFDQGFSRFLHQGSPAPVSNIAFGKSLGGTLPNNLLYKVIAQSENGRKDLPIRVTQIRCINQFDDHPTVRSLIERGSAILKKYGFYVDGREGTRPENMFADEVGKQLRRVGGVLSYGGVKIRSYKHLAEAVFYLALREYDPAKAEVVRSDLSFKDKDLTLVTGLLSSLKEVKKHGKKARE